ncbi:MAG TPA: D-alanine--D-alanine ligase, partial [Bacillota bacterium]|nr:D-alanine--D-alanine ligase [Bacillota bacterium]
LFAKPVAEGTSKGIAATSKIDNYQALQRVCLNLLRTFQQPVLIEGYLPGREFTVGIIGTGSTATVLGVMEVLLEEKAQTGVYSYYNKQNYQGLVKYGLVTGATDQACSEAALKAWRGLGCRDAGRVDLKLDGAGVPNFIEVNPLAGLNPQHSDLPILARLTGVDFSNLITMILDAAQKRINLQV